MKLKNRGFVLLSVLVFLQIFTLLSMLVYFSVSLTLKSRDQAWKRQKQTWQATQLLQQLEVTGSNSFCIINQTPINIILLESKNWWRQHGCRVDSAYYVIEALGVDSCVVVLINTNNQRLIASYYRVTLRLLEADNVILQRIIIKPVTTQQRCENDEREVRNLSLIRRLI